MTGALLGAVETATSTDHAWVVDLPLWVETTTVIGVAPVLRHGGSQDRPEAPLLNINVPSALLPALEGLRGA